MDLFHPSEPDIKVAECCAVSAFAGDAFHGNTIAEGMVKLIMGRIIDAKCPLFVTVPYDDPPQLTLGNVKRGITVWPGAYLRPHEATL